MSDFQTYAGYAGYAVIGAGGLATFYFAGRLLKPVFAALNGVTRAIRKASPVVIATTAAVGGPIVAGTIEASYPGYGGGAYGAMAIAIVYSAVTQIRGH